MKTRHIALMLIVCLAVFGCASVIYVPQKPLIISKQPKKPPDAYPVIGLVRLQDPGPDAERFDRDLARALNTAMMSGCLLVGSNVRTFDAEPADPQIDLLLIPSNPYYDHHKVGYGKEVVISMDVRIVQKGAKSEKGFLVEANGHAGNSRPKRKVKIRDHSFGLIGEKVMATPFERSLNRALFNFSIKFAKQLEKRVERYLITNPTMTPSES